MGFLRENRGFGGSGRGKSRKRTKKRGFWGFFKGKKGFLKGSGRGKKEKFWGFFEKTAVFGRNVDFRQEKQENLALPSLLIRHFAKIAKIGQESCKDLPGAGRGKWGFWTTFWNRGRFWTKSGI